MSKWSAKNKRQKELYYSCKSFLNKFLSVFFNKFIKARLVFPRAQAAAIKEKIHTYMHVFPWYNCKKIIYFFEERFACLTYFMATSFYHPNLHCLDFQFYLSWKFRCMLILGYMLYNIKWKSFKFMLQNRIILWIIKTKNQ